MNRILLPSLGPIKWRRYLANPGKQWKRGRSAMELAISWERAQQASGRGLPVEVAEILDTLEVLKSAELLIAIPEHKICLDSGNAPSHNDLWGLLRNDRGLISLTIEAKAGESFDKTITEWLNKDEKRKGRERRLQWLCEALGTSDAIEACGFLRYQLFHRTVSAIQEAKCFGAASAVMLVQAFPGAEASIGDLQHFGEYLGADLRAETIAMSSRRGQPSLHIGWVSSRCASNAEIAAYKLNQ